MERVHFDVSTLDDIRAAWDAGAHSDVRGLQVASMSLGAALEAAIWGFADSSVPIRSWSQSSEELRSAAVALAGGNVDKPGDHDAPRFELRRCPSRSELGLAPDAGGVEWQYFLDRFRRSLAAHLRVPASTAWALSASLLEMVDNVVEHAGLGDEPLGLVAYEVGDSEFGFAVADVGQGVLASLRRNPNHRALAHDGEALLAAVTEEASRRTGARGTGFAQLLRALADLDGMWFFRTGGARLRLDGRGTGDRVVAPSNCTNMCGFQLSVTARPRNSVWNH